MKNRKQIGETRHHDGLNDACTAWSMLLPDAADGLLSEAEESAFTQHLSQCAPCSQEFAEAQRGLGWLAVLKHHAPEPPDRLLGNILAQTTGAEPLPVMPMPGTAAAWVHGVVTPAVHLQSEWGGRLRSWMGLDARQWSSLLQPRLAMTGAMAFFSVCLTLNLTGLSLSQLREQGLSRPGLQRSVADAGASAVRSFQGLRVVYRVESRVSELRAQNDAPPSQQQGQ